MIILVAMIGPAYGQARQHHGTGYLLSFSYGSHSISFPTVPLAEFGDVGFEDYYESKSGSCYGGTVGIGGVRAGMFLLIKGRWWQKKGHPLSVAGFQASGDITWKQNFISLGLRYYLVRSGSLSHRLLLSFGAGVVRSSATESGLVTVAADGITETGMAYGRMSGTGFYGEVGADLFVSRYFSLRGAVEYNRLNLGINYFGSVASIDGGGGITMLFSLVAHPGGALRTPGVK